MYIQYMINNIIFYHMMSYYDNMIYTPFLVLICFFFTTLGLATFFFTEDLTLAFFVVVPGVV